MPCSHARTSVGRLRRCRRGATTRWSRGSTFDAARLRRGSLAIFVAAAWRAEIENFAADAQGKRALRDDECPTHWIAHHLHASRRHTAARTRRPIEPFDDAAPQASQGTKNKKEQNEIEDDTHQAPG